MEQVNAFKAVVAAIIAALTALWGWVGWLVFAWIALMAIDYATGTMAGLKNGEWKSKIAKEGLWRKGGGIAVVAVAAMTDMTMELALSNAFAQQLPFEYPMLLWPLALTWYILTEIGSIIENVGKMGAPLPPFLLQIVNVLKSGIGDAGSKFFHKSGDTDKPPDPDEQGRKQAYDKLP